MSDERELFDPTQYRASKLGDFRGLPDTVWPTNVHLLEQGGDILVYRVADAAKGVTRKQDQIFRILARMGSHPDAPGTVTTLVVTGLPGVTARAMAVYDHTDRDRVLTPADPDWPAQFISGWWNERRGRR